MRISYFIAKLFKKINIAAIKNSDIHKTSKISSFSHVVDVKMDRYSYIGNNCTVINIDIGAFCSIADNVIIGGASHPTGWVSTSPVFNKNKNIMRKNFSHKPYETTKKTTIKNDVWVGNNSVIKSGVTIENGAIIGMGSVVTKNVGAYEIWAGNPAKLIRKRFNDKDIELLINSDWWCWDDDEINKYANLISSHKLFIDLLIKKTR